jgi:hypothetical protein
LRCLKEREAALFSALSAAQMKMANVTSILLYVRLDHLLKADEATVKNVVMHVCSEINSQVTSAGNA